MHFLKGDNWLRDILLFFVLIFLVKTTSDRSNDLQQNADRQPFTVHEVDQTVVKNIKQAQKQIDKLSAFAQKSDNVELLTTTQELRDTVDILYKQYTTTSPALSLLGPLGSAAIVLKEQELEKRLLSTINETGKLLHNFVQPDVQYESANSTESALKNNRQLLKKLKTKH